MIPERKTTSSELGWQRHQPTAPVSAWQKHYFSLGEKKSNYA
jgi:hypothetical protein